MKIQTINPLEYRNWNELILSMDNHSIFYTSFWAEVLQQSYQYKPVYFCILNKNQFDFFLPAMTVQSRLTGSRGVSLPFTDFCDPIMKPNCDFKELFNHIIQIGRTENWQSFECRGGEQLFLGTKPSVRHYGHELFLENGQDLEQRLKDPTRRNIKKAIKKGVQINIAQMPDAMDAFYHLNCITRKKHGLPPQPVYFFRNVFRFIIQNNYGIIIQATYQNKIIASAIFFHFGKTALYKYGASDPRYLHLRPNNLIMWEAIKYYYDNGYSTLNFGKTQVENEGLRRFKLGWGTHEKLILYFKYNLNKNVFVQEKSMENRWYNAFFRKTPLPLLNQIGRFTYKHIG